MIGAFTSNYEVIELLCSIDIEQTPFSFHAHQIPENVIIGPGDTIIVHDAPTGIGFGESYTGERRATLYRAGPWARLGRKSPRCSISANSMKSLQPGRGCGKIFRSERLTP